MNSSLFRLVLATVLLWSNPRPGPGAEFAKVLTDSHNGISMRSWKLTSNDVGANKAGAPWSVAKRTLAGGRQEGVEVINVDNGAMKFIVVPTRGFSVWSLHAGDLRFGWDSPVQEIVHPQFVNLSARSGRGWFDGFGGWMVRCGLESNGASGNDGSQFLNLHGRIDYIPASRVEVLYEAKPEPRIVLRGVVDESLMYGPQLRLSAEISTVVGSKEIRFDDTITNLADVPQEMELLYHINFGTPLIGAGAEFVAPVKTLAPRDPRAAEGDINLWAQYQGPQPVGYTEQVYFLELQADRGGMTEVLLKSPDGRHGASLRFNTSEMPYFTLWKNESPLKTGYVTGLEPATNFPNLRAQERAAGRVPKLLGGQSYRSQITVTALTSAADVNEAQGRIKSLQTTAPIVSPSQRELD